MKKTILLLSFTLIAILSFAASSKKEISSEKLLFLSDETAELREMRQECTNECNCFTLITVPCHIETTFCYCGNPSPETFFRWITETDEEVCGPQ